MAKRLELTPRLQLLADWGPQGAKFADIGTDHAYLPVWLTLQGRLQCAIASDLRKGPLERAREPGRTYGAGNLDYRLANGLADVSPEEADVIAIAGMGGETIASILAAAPWTRECKLLLQPMTSFPDLRFWLQQNGYMIENEKVIREGERLYSIWNVTGGTMKQLSPAELWVGVQSDDPLRMEYLTMMEEKLERSLRGHLAASTPNETEITALTEILAELRCMKGELE